MNMARSALRLAKCAAIILSFFIGSVAAVCSGPQGNLGGSCDGTLSTINGAAACVTSADCPGGDAGTCCTPSGFCVPTGLDGTCVVFTNSICTTDADCLGGGAGDCCSPGGFCVPAGADGTCSILPNIGAGSYPRPLGPLPNGGSGPKGSNNAGRGNP